MAKKVAVVSIKGGVGKTTTSINVAAYVAAMGVRVLLIDLDPQNGCMFGMGLDVREGYGVKDVVLGRVEPAAALTQTNRPELRVMMAGDFSSVDELEDFTRECDRNPYCLAQMLERLQESRAFLPDLVLFDGPAGVTPITVAALAAADSIILPVQCEPLSLRTLPQMLRSVAKIKAKYNQGLEVEGILLTMYDVKHEAKLGIAAQIWDNFPTELVFETVIPRQEQLVESFAVGAPAIDISSRSVGAQAYIQLGRELIMRLPEPALTN
ncbi:MAG: ParA family protein [Blastocatellia bacterium]|nr:ParA family protein [Blastocatellia bacterium]